MSRYKPFWQLLLIELAVLVVLVVSYHFHLPIGCPFKMLTGIPCPGCGGTRALMALLHGHIWEAIMTNPFSVLVILFAIIAPVWQFVDCYRNTKTLQRAMTSKWPTPALILIAVLVLANWIWNIYKGL